MENKVSVKVLKVVLTVRCMVSDEDGLCSLKGSFHWWWSLFRVVSVGGSLQWRWFLVSVRVTSVEASGECECSICWGLWWVWGWFLLRLLVSVSVASVEASGECECSICWDLWCMWVWHLLRPLVSVSVASVEASGECECSICWGLWWVWGWHLLRPLVSDCVRVTFVSDSLLLVLSHKGSLCWGKSPLILVCVLAGKRGQDLL